MLLRDNLQPTDFADADCRVSRWVDFEHYGEAAYRVWECRCTNFWFQRHEWRRNGENQTRMDGWIFSGYFPRRTFAAGMMPAPNLEDV